LQDDECRGWERCWRWITEIIVLIRLILIILWDEGGWRIKKEFEWFEGTYRGREGWMDWLSPRCLK